ncbi:MAG TPA: dihydropteroate synthase [Acidobacteriaceae bacterium]|nr:dihydropteroate synthase [Acidobacteriaceae bacterium]
MPVAPRPLFRWNLHSRQLSLGPRTMVVGVVNVTPDSFSDGGKFFSAARAVEHALRLLDEGADILDLGGESTRPGTRPPVSAQEELDRVLPVIEAILHERSGTILSIDTYKAETARAAVTAGAEIVNDVSGFLWDPGMAAICAELGCGVILMHTRGRSQEWRTQPPLPHDEVVPLVLRELEQRTRAALAAGVRQAAMVLDPGFGFGKALDENYPLLAHFEALHALGYPLLAGPSRKSFLGKTLAPIHGHDIPPDQRDNATLAAITATVLAGAHLVRVHNVQAAREAIAIADAIRADLLMKVNKKQEN